MEGVMMRSPRSFAVVCRSTSGELVVKEQAWRSLWEHLGFLRWPFLRGSVVLFESLANGMSALSFSAKVQMAGDKRESPDGDRQAGSDEGGAGAASEPASSGDEPGATPASSEEGAASAPSGAASQGVRALSLEQAEGDAPSFVPVIAFSVLVALGLFVGLPHLLTALLGYSPASFGFHLVDGLIKAAIFLAYVAGIGLFEDIRRVFMYHGAEHKAIFTHEKGLDMTVENARLQSRFHPRCGTSFLFIVILVSILLFAVTLRVPIVENRILDHVIKILVKVPLLLPVAGLSYEILRLSAKFQGFPPLVALTWPGMLLQRLTTREPTADQLEVALVAIQKTLWRERLGRQEKEPAPAVEVFPSFEAARAGLG
jgi:uncharacterized protein YqhQ